MDKNAVATNVATRLVATEAAIDEAIFEASKLLEVMTQGRRDLNLTVFSAQGAQARVVETIAALSEAHRAVMAAHTAMQILSRKLGVETTALGGNDTNTSAHAIEEVTAKPAELPIAV